MLTFLGAFRTIKAETRLRRTGCWSRTNRDFSTGSAAGRGNDGNERAVSPRDRAPGETARRAFSVVLFPIRGGNLEERERLDHALVDSPPERDGHDNPGDGDR